MYHSGEHDLYQLNPGKKNRRLNFVYFLMNICSGYDYGHKFLLAPNGSFGFENKSRQQKTQTMRTIIVPTDFSATAGNAVEYAARLAMTMNARLMLFHVYNINIGYPEVYPISNVQEMQEYYEQEINTLRDKLLESTQNRIRITTQVSLGFFFEQLKELCEEEEPYMVIMGSQGATAAEYIFFGGNTVRALKHLRWPVIAVPPGVTFNGIKKIGLACDMEEVIDTLPATELNTLVKEYGATLHVINTGTQKASAVAETVFQSAMADELLTGSKPLYHFNTAADTDQGILDFATKEALDLLVILPRHHKLLERILHKSHTKQLVLKSKLPVLALHAEKADHSS